MKILSSKKIALLSAVVMAHAVSAGSYVDVSTKDIKLPASDSYYSAFVGASLGLGGYNGYYAAVRTDVVASTPDTHSAYVGVNSALFGGVVGVEALYKDMYYGAVVANATYNTLSHDLRLSTNTSGVYDTIASVENKFQWGANVRLGRLVGSAKPYVLVGMQSGNWTMGLVNNSSDNKRGIAANTNTDYSKTLYAPQLGLGVIVPMSEKMSAGLEYSYTKFGTVDQSLTASSQTWKHSLRNSQNTFAMTVNYNIA